MVKRGICFLFFLLSIPLFSQENGNLAEADIQKLSSTPSEKNLNLLLQIIEQDRREEIVREARRIRREMQKFLFQEDIPALSFRYKDKDFSLRKTLFDEKVNSSKWCGDAKGFTLFYILDHILECELNAHAGQKLPGSIYSSSGRNRYLPTLDDLNKRIEKEAIRIFEKHEKGSFKEEVILDRLKETFYHQAKKEVFKYLIDKELGLKGKSKDDFGPQRIRSYYAEQKSVYEKFLEKFSQENTEWSPTQRSAEHVESFLKLNPQMKFLIKLPRVNLQAVWFVFPALNHYQKKDPKHFEEARTIIQGFYKDIFSKEFLNALKEEVLSIFDIKDEPQETPAVKEEYIKKLESQIEKQKKYIAQELRAEALKNSLDLTKEKVVEMLVLYFERAKEILADEKSLNFTPAHALFNALEEARGQLLLQGKLSQDQPPSQGKLSQDQPPSQGEPSQGQPSLLGNFMSFCGGIMNMKMRDSIFSHLEKRKEQFQNAYDSVVKEEDNIGKKVEVFQKLVSEFQSQYPLEFIFVEPDWIERGENLAVPEIEYMSFYGKNRKKAGDQEIYYFWNDPSPSLTLFQWVMTEEERFLRFDENIGEQSVGRFIQDFLFSNERLKIAPSIEQELFRKYRPYIELYTILDANWDYETLIQDSSVYRAFF